MDSVKEKIVKQLSFIKDCTTDIDGITDRLIQDGVIPIQDRHSVLSPRNTKDQIQNVLDIIIRKKREDTFISALKETKNDHVVDRIFGVVQLPKGQHLTESSSFEALVECEARKDVSTQVDIMDTKHEKNTMNLRKEIDDLKEENCVIKNENKELREKITKIENEYRKLEEGNEHLKQVQGNIRKENEKAREKFSKMDKENIELKKALEVAVEPKVDPNTDEINFIREELSNLRENSNSTGQMLLAHEQEHKTQREDIKEIKCKMTGFQLLFDEINKLKEESRNVRTELEEIQSSKNDRCLQNVETQTCTVDRKKPGSLTMRHNIFPSTSNSVRETNVHWSSENSFEKTYSPRTGQVKSRQNLFLSKSKSDFTGRYRKR